MREESTSLERNPTHHGDSSMSAIFRIDHHRRHRTVDMLRRPHKLKVRPAPAPSRTISHVHIPHAITVAVAAHTPHTRRHSRTQTHSHSHSRPLTPAYTLTHIVLATPTPTDATTTTVMTPHLHSLTAQRTTVLLVIEYYVSLAPCSVGPDDQR